MSECAQNWRVKAILLDLDGTLTDPKIGITSCIRYALNGLNITEVPDDLDWCIGPPLINSFATLLNSNDTALLDQALGLYRARFSTVGMYENSVYPEITQGLQQLQQAGFQLYLATSKPHIYAKQILEHFELNQFFNAVYGSELSGERTDKTELIHYILAQEKLNPKQCVMVGDRKYDIIGAKNNGICSIAITYGYGSRAELNEACPDYMFEQFNRVVDFLIKKILDRTSSQNQPTLRQIIKPLKTEALPPPESQ